MASKEPLGNGVIIDVLVDLCIKKLWMICLGGSASISKRSFQEKEQVRKDRYENTKGPVVERPIPKNKKKK